MRGAHFQNIFIVNIAAIKHFPRVPSHHYTVFLTFPPEVVLRRDSTKQHYPFWGIDAELVWLYRPEKFLEQVRNKNVLTVLLLYSNAYTDTL